MTSSSCIGVAVNVAPQASETGLAAAGPEQGTTLIDARIVGQLHPVLLRVAQRMVGRGAYAEDIVQETWLSALSGAHAFQGRSSLLTWLVAIMRRRVCDSRRRSRFPMQPLDDSCWIAEPTFVEQLHARSDLMSLRVPLEELAARERAALALCFIQELERDEAADALGVTRGHLRVLLHRGQVRLRRAAKGMAGPVGQS